MWNKNHCLNKLMLPYDDSNILKFQQFFIK